jgi:hypothetical protein
VKAYRGRHEEGDEPEEFVDVRLTALEPTTFAFCATAAGLDIVDRFIRHADVQTVAGGAPSEERPI